MRRPGWGTVVVLAATASAMVYAYVSTHQIYPDTQLYLGWTYRLMGHDAAGAERLVREYIVANAVFDPYDTLFGSSVHDLMYRPRQLLPVLSVPFVAVFGPGGIVVVPGAAFGGAMYLIYRFATIHASVPASVAACVLAVASPLVVRWSVGGLTDSLALMLHAAMFLLLPWRTTAGRWAVTGVGVVCALGATARTNLPFTVTAMAGLWLWAMLRGSRALRRSWMAVAMAAAVGTIAGLAWTRWTSAPLTLMSVFTAGTGGAVRRYADLPGWYATHLPGRAVEEAGRILGSWPLAAVVALSLVACITAWRTVVPWLVVPAWLGALGVFMTNPAITAFRYELPVLPALVVAVAVLADQVTGRRFGSVVGMRWRRVRGRVLGPAG